MVSHENMLASNIFMDVAGYILYIQIQMNEITMDENRDHEFEGV